jgi:hypothetical protein
MNIFLSHAIADKSIIENIEKTLKPYGLNLFIAEHTRSVDSNITEKIELMIQNSHIGLVLLTEKGFNSHFVQQEIGYLKSLKKPFIQVIQLGFENQIKGFNYGKDFIQLDPNNINATVEEIKKDLLKFRKRIIFQNKMKHDQIIAAQKLETQRKKQNENTALGILAGLLVLAIVTE